MNLDERFPDPGVVRDVENGGNEYYDDYDYATLEDILNDMVEAREIVGYAMGAVQQANDAYRNALEQEGMYDATRNGEEELSEAFERISNSIVEVQNRMGVAELEEDW